MNCLKAALIVGAFFCASSGAQASANEATSGVAMQSESLDAQELRCMTEAVYREAGSEPMKGRYAVAQVIVNRMRSGLFPSSVCGVVRQKGQFTFPKGLGPKKGYGEARLWNEAKEIAASVMTGNVGHVADEVLYFRSSRMRKPAGLRFMGSIGGHSFYAGK
ncbi:MAG: cell wall hydrolase [Acidobacteria bacterium]|nr:cell wall hydrolase [Acidobacteriota bacterium]|tara:strand:- start:691 stop:1176 length:486 start_codon:yes stop_codon:yes gene_type:complete